MIRSSIHQFISTKKALKKTILFSVMATGLSAAFNANATIVQFQTNMGNFEVNLYDNDTPKTVANFLAYVKSSAYQNSIVHRSVPGFIIQGGGYTYISKLAPITANAAVAVEPVFSNKRGTIAMARLSQQPNSATNQWFINLADNSTSLDTEKSADSTYSGPGYTVFGEVVGTAGMSIIDAIAALNVIDGYADPFREVPLNNFTQANADAGLSPTQSNFVLIQNVVILNADPATAANLTPAKTTYVATSAASSSSSTSSVTSSSSSSISGGSTSGGTSSGSGGGGSVGWLELLALLSITTLSCLRKQK